MGVIRTDVYLFFNGNCREAIEFYRTIFGGDIYYQTYKEAMGDKASEEEKGWVMHAALKGGDVEMMASDTEKASPVAKKVSISLSGDDEEKLRKIFAYLSQEVEVRFPLKKEFWGDTFGTVTDKYGIEWMVNIREPKS